MRSLWYIIIIVLAIAGPYRYLTSGADARDARFAYLEKVREDVIGVRTMLGDTPPPTAHLIDTRRASLDALDQGVAAFGDTLRRGAAPTVDTLRAAGVSAGVGDPVLGPLLSTIGRGAHAPLRRTALATILRALDAAGRPAVESLDVAAAPSTRPDAPPLTLLRIGLTVVGPPTELVGLAERLVAGTEADPPGDIVEARIEKTDDAKWERVGAGTAAPPVRLVLRVELMLGGG